MGPELKSPKLNDSSQRREFAPFMARPLVIADWIKVEGRGRRPDKTSNRWQ